MSDYRKVFNVADYGALGQDVDYTTEINAALSAIAALYGHTQPVVFIPREYTLYFPPGRYRINSPIVMGDHLSGLHIVGDNAVIMPTQGANFVVNGQLQFAFEHTYAYDFKMEGMHFAHFEKAVRVFKPFNSTDSGMTLIDKCTFMDNSEIGLAIGYTSGLAKIEGCKFMENKVALDIESGDKILVRRCWISNESQMAGTHPSPIINGSASPDCRLTLESCVLTPQAVASNCYEPAWIKNYGSVTVRDTRQGGETNSFTLVNNFAVVGNLLSGSPEPSSVIVKDSQCYAAYNNSGPAYSIGDGYRQPAILRYVGAIPNITAIEDNRGMVEAKSIGFSRMMYHDDPQDILDMIENSGAAGVINAFNVSVKVANNVGGLGHAPTGSVIPSELHQFVRDEAHLWPYKPQKELSLLGGNAASGFEFEYPLDSTGSINKPLLLEFSGNPNSGGWAKYSGGVVGIIKANGAYNGNLGYKLTFEPLYNINGTGSLTDFAVTLEWDAVPDGDKTFLPDGASANRHFLVKVAGPDGAYDQIRVTPLDAMMK